MKVLEARHYIQERCRKLQRFMEEKQLDVVIVTRPENVYYLSRFNPILNSHPAFVAVFREGENCLLVHSIRCDHAKTESAAGNVELYGKWGDHASLALEPVDALKKVISSRVGEKINWALEMDYVSVSLYSKLCKTLETPAMADIAPFLSRQKLVKDELEVEKIRRAAALADEGTRTTIAHLRKGRSEAEACTEGQYAMRQMWHQHFPDEEVAGFGSSEGGVLDALHCWCLTGPRIAYGCDCPIHYVPQPGELVLPMTWAKISGYYAENERTLYVVELDAFKQQAFATVLEARRQVLDALRPGVSFDRLYAAAASVFDQNGFAALKPGRVGHGIGLSAHEFPSLAPGNEMVLEPGMVFTVEPGLMSRQWGGVRISDTVLVTRQGYEQITQSESGMLRI
ncbi:MAG TPA: Xaa-Pro peptidase family protein [Patescibacteria group bacterium]|nr:Xaa-Pro peptidase family protein [Patescibacteria group bacterium]